MKSLQETSLLVEQLAVQAQSGQWKVKSEAKGLNMPDITLFGKLYSFQAAQDPARYFVV